MTKQSSRKHSFTLFLSINHAASDILLYLFICIDDEIPALKRKHPESPRSINSGEHAEKRSRQAAEQQGQGTSVPEADNIDRIVALAETSAPKSKQTEAPIVMTSSTSTMHVSTLSLLNSSSTQVTPEAAFDC
jgi:hypothetical protein